MTPLLRRAAVGLGSLSLAATVTGVACPAQALPTGDGPSTTVAPYVLPVHAGVSMTSLLTVDDAARPDPGVDMVGVPDGLGAFEDDGDLVVYMNHEYGATTGAVRAHGQRGSFVSRNVVDPATGEVLETGDLVRDVAYWDYATGSYASAATAPFSSAFSRFCSGSLTDPGQLDGPGASRYGYGGQVFFANEENGDNGRLFGVTGNGTATQLPRLGLFSWENTLAADTGNRATVVIGNEDGGSGQLRVYTGRKEKSGSALDRAGLTNGSLAVIDVADQAVSTDAGYRAAYGTGTEVPVVLHGIDWTKSGAAQNADAAAAGLSLDRIEDGAFDPRHPDDYYFITTEGGGTASVETDPVTGAPVSRDGGGLWRLRFDDVKDPAEGATLELLLDGTEAPYLNKPDNMDVDHAGHLLIQEDPGGNAHLARVLAYDLASGDIATLAQFDPAHFAPGATAYPHTTDEESSAIIDVADLMGAGTFLLDAQVHTSAGLSDPARQVEHGQLLSMTVDWDAVF
jgi:hypothetical protein